MLRVRPHAVISVDTYKAEVARRAVLAGAQVVNDVSAGSWDALMLRTLADLQCGAVLMHTRGRPEEWRTLPPVDDMVALVHRDLEQRARAAVAAGLAREAHRARPWLRFRAKTLTELYSAGRSGPAGGPQGYPLLAGTSRKGFIGRTLVAQGGPAPGNVSTVRWPTLTASILNGAHIVRVHDVAPSVQAARIADELLRALPEGNSD